MMLSNDGMELDQIQPVVAKEPELSNQNIATNSHLSDSKQRHISSSATITEENTIQPESRPYSPWYRAYLSRYTHANSHMLIIFRVIAIILKLTCLVSDTMAFSTSGRITREFRGVRFVVGGNYIYSEIGTMIYASGAAVFGTTIDFLIVLILSTVNCILVQINCQNSSRRNASIFWVIRMCILYSFVELCYQNFKKLSRYQQAFEKSAHAMMRQTLLFSFTALFLTAPGLRTVHENVVNPPPRCPYVTNQCGLVELYEPEFEEGHPCEEAFITYITSREELRIIRNLILIHIAFYAMFNTMFLKVNSDAVYYYRRSALILLFAVLATSVVYSNVSSYRFVRRPKITYDIIEVVFFVLLLSILWSRMRMERTNLDNTPLEQISRQLPINESTTGMIENPEIFIF